MLLEIIAKPTSSIDGPSSTDGRINISDGMLIISADSDGSRSVDVPQGKLTITGNDAYVAALKLYDVVYVNRTTESTTETTTKLDYEFDFSELATGTYTTDFTNGIFSLIAGEGNYSIGGTDEKYIILNSPVYSSNPSEDYILIDASEMSNGFTLSFDAALNTGYSYGRLTLADENGEAVNATEVYNSSDKSSKTLSTDTAGKYTLKVTSGLPINIYKLGITKKS